MATKILIADDEPNIVISLEFLLKREGYEVVVAHDGAQALERIRSERPDMAILDVMMPHRNGFEVCQDLRQDPEFKTLRIMMLIAKVKALLDRP
jgi:DNA-binding response OmpR family regulator